MFQFKSDADSLHFAKGKTASMYDTATAKLNPNSRSGLMLAADQGLHLHGCQTLASNRLYTVCMKVTYARWTNRTGNKRRWLIATN